jgi:hypothetical protein
VSTSRAQQQIGLFWRSLLQIAIEARSAYLGYLALLFHGQSYSFERERDFNAAIDALPPSLARIDAAPPTCSKARFKKSTSSCLRRVAQVSLLRPGVLAEDLGLTPAEDVRRKLAHSVRRLT